MPATTSAGLPYPLDTDPLANIAVAIKNLAQALNDRVQAFEVTITPVTNTATSRHVNFAVPFAAPPVVTATAKSTVPGERVIEVGVANITTTGCDVFIYRNNTLATPVAVIAVPATQPAIV